MLVASLDERATKLQDVSGEDRAEFAAAAAIVRRGLGFIRGGGQFRLVRCAARQQGIARSPPGVPKLLRV